MHFLSFLAFGGLVPISLAAYSLQDDYSGDNFFNMFTFDTENDPTNGYVNYVDQSTAQSSGLIDTSNGAVTLRADSTNVASGRGRNSIRVTSSKQYNHALIVIDLAHMPGNACGIWPAFWTTGPNWPNSGEIDIIEGVNTQSQNQMTMHTSDGCSLAGSSCLANQGCSLKGGAFGDGFNSNNGGTYAMEWTGDAINIWFFSRGSEPGGILGDSPDPSNWGSPTGNFQGGSSCNIDTYFKNQNIVFDTTFCGDWAGQAFSSDSTCSSKASSCQDFVQNNPQAFTEAYWTINALKVYSSDGSSNSAQSGQAAPPSSATSVALQQPSEVPTDAPQPTEAPVSLVSSAVLSQQPSGGSPSDGPIVTSFVDGGPVTVTTIAPDFTQAPVVTQVVTGPPVVVTLPPGSEPPQHRGHNGGGGGGYGPPNKRKRAWARRHLADHIRGIAVEQHS